MTSPHSENITPSIQPGPKGLPFCPGGADGLAIRLNQSFEVRGVHEKARIRNADMATTRVNRYRYRYEFGNGAISYMLV